MDKEPIVYRRSLLLLVLLGATLGFPLPLSAGRILIYGPSMSVTAPNERTIAESNGHVVDIAFPGGGSGSWDMMTTEGFAFYDAIVFGDPECSINLSLLDAAIANRSVWSAAIQGNIVIVGTDPIMRIRRGDIQGHAEQLTRNAINFAASGSGTGLYVSLSCYYALFSPGFEQPVEVLAGLGDFRVEGSDPPAPNCSDIVVITDPDHPVMAGLTGAGLSGWQCSMREWFTVFPSNFRVLATETDRPYIIATGEVGVTLRTNPSANPSIGAPSANIVRGDGADQTTLYVSLEPPAQTTVGLSANFGSVPGSVQTNTDGKATATFTSGMAPTDATTTIATITATATGNEGSTEVYNFRGFQEYDFRQTQVSDSKFIAHTEWGVSRVQQFFVDRNSFLAKFYLVGSQGDRGFYDTNGNGNYNSGEPKYCADPQVPDCSMNGSKTSAAQAFVNAATKQGQRVNPKLLLVQAQKEKQLITSSQMPSRDILNWGLGCLTPSTFGPQINCAAERQRRWFDGTGVPAMPYFWPLVPGPDPEQSINHYVNNPPAPLGLQRVGFSVFTRATHSLYKYTNRITKEAAGGGNYLFEQLWQQYSTQEPDW